MALDVVTVTNLSVAANAVSADQFSNQIPQFVVGPALIRVRAVAQAVGLNMSLTLDGRLRVNDQQIGARAGAVTTIRDDFIGEFPYDGGRTIVTFRNTTGAAIICNGMFEVFHP
jgi:hypothetical protein